MDDLKSALREHKISESALVKLLKGFGPERGGEFTLVVPVSDKGEQALVLSILSLLDRQIKVEDANEYIKPHAIIVGEGGVLIKKIQQYDYGIDLKGDCGDAVQYLEALINDGGEVRLLEGSFSTDFRPYLSIKGFPSEDHAYKLVNLLRASGIEVEKCNISDKNDNPLHRLYDNNYGNPSISLSGRAALRIAERLSNKGINFEGRRYLSSGTERF